MGRRIHGADLRDRFTGDGLANSLEKKLRRRSVVDIRSFQRLIRAAERNAGQPSRLALPS